MVLGIFGFIIASWIVRVLRRMRLNQRLRCYGLSDKAESTAETGRRKPRAEIPTRT